MLHAFFIDSAPVIRMQYNANKFDLTCVDLVMLRDTTLLHD